MPAASAIFTEFVEQTGIGMAFTVDSVATTGIVSIKHLAHSNRGTNEFNGWWIWLPTLTGNLEVKTATTLTTSTGALAHGSGANYAGTEGAVACVLLRPEWHPNFVMYPLLNRALKMTWQWWRTILSVVPNGDGEATSVGGSNSGGTATRDTTAADVFDGQASIRFANSGASGYHQYASFDAHASKPFTFSAWVRITGGTARFQLIDVSNSNAVIEEVTVTGVGQFHYLELTGTFPATCYSAAVRVGADEATGDTNWDDVYGYPEGITKVTGPSWITELKTEQGEDAFRLYKARNKQLTSGTGPGRTYGLELIPETDYQILNMPSAANPVELELSEKLTQHGAPIIVEARRNFYDFGALSTWAGTTNCPLMLVVAAMKLIYSRERGVGNTALLKDLYDSEQRKGESDLRVPPPDDVSRPFSLFVQRLG